MDNALVTILSLIGTTLLTLTVTSIYHHFVNGSKKAREKKKRERKGELKELFDEFSQPIITKLDNAEKKLDKVADGTRNSLRNDILKYYYDCLKKGYRTEKDTNNFDGMYNSYIALGGNSFIKEEIYPKFHDEIELLTEKEVYEIEHIKKSEKEDFDKKLEFVINRSMQCPLYKEKKTRKTKTSKKKQILLEDKDN